LRPKKLPFRNPGPARISVSIEEIGNGGQKTTSEGKNFFVAAGGTGKSVEAAMLHMGSFSAGR
jgi:hypothetical protein